LPGGPADPAAVARALATITPAIAPGTVLTTLPIDTEPTPQAGATAAVRGTAPGAGAGAGAGAAELIRFGADVHRLRVALSAEGLLSIVIPDPGSATVDATTPIYPDPGKAAVLILISGP
jgi:coenzyme F420-0:L-glutamate ligase/coenzyme F420-1:gamma-L-glutamate ligase